MEIKRGNTVVCDVYLKDNSYTVEEIMGEDTLTLNFLSRNVVELQINDYIDFEGTKYKIRHNEKVTKRETSLGWEYTVMFYSSRYDLEDVAFFLNGKPEYKKNFDYYTGTARQILELIVKNMNREDSGWKVGSCIDSRSITISFKDKNVGPVLDDTVKQLDTEYWIYQKTISIGKRKYDSNGLVLGQGEGLGFTELEISAVSDERPTTVIFPYGSDKNLGSDYGADYLMLPGGQEELSKNTEKYGRLGQKKIPFDHIFPKGEFHVSSKIDDFTLRASDIDFNLDDCKIGEEDIIASFQDGGLAGYDLAIVEGSWDNDLKQFKLKVNEQENSLVVPGDINFSVGDKFILTGLKMPQSYIDKASQQLLEESQAWLDEHCEKRIQLRGKCDEVIFRLQNLFIACGQMVGVYSEQLNIDREIRVTRVKRYIENDNKPSYRYELTLSDFLESNGFKDLVDDVNKVPEEIEDKVKPVREHTKRSWKDVMETMKMMFDPEGDYFTELIKPLVVHTAQLIVGTNSQQMELIGVKFIPNADNDANYFKNTAGKLVHFTVSDTVREWIIPESSFRLSNSLAYYVYAKCPKEGDRGSIYVTERQIKLEDEEGYYHFWVGVLNTPEDGVRSWLPNYGFSEIAGQTITTGLIKDKLARLVIDLVNARITADDGAEIIGKITFGEGSSGLDNIAEWPAAKQDITDAKNSANNAKQSVTSLGNYVDGAFADGIIEESEAKAIEKYINTVNNSKASVEATYNQLYVNSYLTGTAKSGLLNAKVTLFGAIDNLISAINSAIYDGRTTVAEKNNVDSKFSLFNSAMASFNTAVETANKAIQDKLKEYADNASGNVPDSFKDSLAQSLGYSNYAALEAEAEKSNTIIKNGKINTTLLEAVAIVTKAFTAGMITTGNLTVTTGAKIADFVVDAGRLKHVGSNFGNTAKLYIGNVDSGNPNTSGARITALGIDAPFTVSNSSAQTQHIKNMFIDNVVTSEKKTSMLIKTSGGGKNTALSIVGNVHITGSMAERGAALIYKMPNSNTGFDHNKVIINSGDYTLPTHDIINAWFGNDPNDWATYLYSGEGGNPQAGADLYTYTLVVFAAYWSTGASVLGTSTTPLYGKGVVRNGSGNKAYGYVNLDPCQGGVFTIFRGCWYYNGSYR